MINFINVLVAIILTTLLAAAFEPTLSTWLTELGDTEQALYCFSLGFLSVFFFACLVTGLFNKGRKIR